MAKTSIIRTVYANRFLYHLDNTLLFQAVCNTDYEGDVNAGSVIINSMTDLTIGDYAGTATVQTLASTSQTLSINNYKYFAQLCDDVDKLQTNLPLVEETAIRGAYGIADAVDAYVASQSYVQGTAFAQGSLGTSGSAYIPTGSSGAGSTYDLVVDMNAQLASVSAPQPGRFVVLPAFAIANLCKDTRVVSFNPVILANGLVQGVSINGMQVFQSNNLISWGSGTTKEYGVIAGQSKAMAFVGALKELETFRSPTSFGDVVRGLYVFGFDVTQTTSVTYTVVRAAGA